MANEQLRVMSELITCARIGMPMSMSSNACVILLNYIRMLEEKIEDHENELQAAMQQGYHDASHGDI